MRVLRFDKGYFLLASGLLGLEVFIALFVHDKIVRPYAGDFLATILLYCGFRSFLKASAWRVAGAALTISYLIEGLQGVNLLQQLGWEHCQVARIVLGSHFEWGDMLAYTLGALVAVGLSQAVSSRRPPPFSPPTAR